MNPPLLILSLLAAATSVAAQDPVELDEITVQGRGSLLVGEAISASEGIIGRVDLEMRPTLRTGEILEAVPGLIVTQHSGSGKANQYFLRGFNLDHGTDFATWIDGMPVNMVTHGHGQGYTDINFIIPEMVDTITYMKGSYYAAVGDFSSAGSATLTTANVLPENQIGLTIGENNYLRALAVASSEVGNGTLTYGLEHTTNDGPWDLEEDLSRVSGQLKYHQFLSDNTDISVNLMAYDSSWDSSDQIPERAVTSGLISPLGFVDDTVGGDSSRYSLSTQITRNERNSETQFSVYSIYYDMNLWSNFTYFLEDPVNGDQFQQSDRRMVYGANLSHKWTDESLFGKRTTHTVGLQTRYDDIDRVGLYHTRARQIIGTNREDSAQESSIGVFYQGAVELTEKLTANFGARWDHYNFKVDSDFAPNSGKANDALISPKFNASYTATDSTELYLSAGYSFHSNDARGSTITIDPADRVTPVDKVDLLVRSFGYEVGARHHWNERNNTSISLWTLDLDSELLYVGDAGNTEASRPSERIGLEIANYLAIADSLTLDLDIAFTDASYSDSSPDGDEIPGAIESVASAGLSYQSPDSPWFGSLRYRSFSDRPLIEDNSVRSGSFRSVNLKIGYKTEQWKASLDILNAFDSDDHDITYFYGSRLQGEDAEGVEDRHFHVIEPLSFRLNFSRIF